jgi:hypothetical protein
MTTILTQNDNFDHFEWNLCHYGLILCSKKKILGVESRHLSHTDTILIIVSSFPKLSEGSRTSFSVSQQLRPELSAKWILSILSDLPLTKKTEKNVYTNSLVNADLFYTNFSNTTFQKEPRYMYLTRIPSLTHT